VGGVTGGVGGEVSECGAGVGVAVGVSGDPVVRGSGDPGAPASPFARDGCAAGVQGGGAGGARGEAGELSHPKALLCDALVGGRVRHSHGAGVVGAPGCLDDDDLHARVEPWGAGSPQSGRHALSNPTRQTGPIRPS